MKGYSTFLGDVVLKLDGDCLKLRHIILKIEVCRYKLHYDLLRTEGDYSRVGDVVIKLIGGLTNVVTRSQSVLQIRHYSSQPRRRFVDAILILE